MPSILDNAHNNHIHDNTFVTKVQGAPSLDILFKRVAPNAILNAGGRADEPRCHPGTREEVVDRIENWRDAKDGLTAPMFWLSGPAGAGKSAIVQTISKRCDEHGAPHANFFFFRTDPSRNQVSPLIATLVYQLISLYPSLRDHIATLLFNDPPMIDSALKDQLSRLIVAPLLTIQQSSPVYHPVLFLIDGLDECDLESKRDQPQILHAFDVVIGENSPACPFRLLVASRNESQIQMAFNKSSSNCMHLYLDDTYSPATDIRKFVNAEFTKVRETHPLGHILDANWPPSEDVNYIVVKSSGQFIFAATAMRFISVSPAAPTISLERIKGTAQLTTKSPFSHLDAIYTYILLKVDDQEALKDILNAQLFINSLSNLYMSTGELVKLYNERYTDAMVLSCLADLSPIGHFSEGRLKFYHASFPDFLLDQLRSGDHFVDITAFNYKVLPIVCKHFTDLSASKLSWSYTDFLKTAITRLNRLPPELLDTLISIKHLTQQYDMFDTQVWKKVYKLCTSDDDVSKFKSLFYHWIRCLKVRMELNRQDIEDIPFGARYYQMADVEYSWTAPDEIVAADLRPKSDFDLRESAVWLKDLLYVIQKARIHIADSEQYTQLVKAWISWAISNDIPLECHGDGRNITALHDCQQSDHLPYICRYFAMVRIARDYKELPSGDIITALQSETYYDRHEIAVWLQDLLNGIHREKYKNDESAYRKFTKAWIRWGVRNDIPLGVPSDRLNIATVDVPYSRRYFAMAHIERDYEALPSSDMTAALHPETDDDRQELLLWLQHLLHGRYRELYSTDPKRYKKVLKAWISWAIRHDIACDGLQDLPGALSYIRRATVKKRVSDAFKIGGSGARQ